MVAFPISRYKTSLNADHDDFEVFQSCHNANSYRPGLVDDRSAKSLEGQTGEPQFGLLDLGDLVDVFQADRTRTVVAGLRGAFPLASLAEWCLCSVEQQP